MSAKEDVPKMRILPDPAICKTLKRGNVDLFDCLVKLPFECKYSVSFGSGFFCNHPERLKFLKKSS